MGARHDPPGGAVAERRRVIYCLLPAELAGLHDVLRRHFRDQPVEVVVESRSGERRDGAERRELEDHRPKAQERRRVRSASGRRLAERRAVASPLVDPPALPLRARRHADRVVFFERLEPSTEELEDIDTARMVTRFQAGDEEAFVGLYTRYFDRVYGYLRYSLADSHEAEDLAQQVFTHLFEKIADYERRRQPFRSWLFVIVRNMAIDHLRRRRAISVEDVEEVNRRRERNGNGDEGLEAINWISDRDLLLFLDRLPAAQRQVLLLRYMLGLSTPEIASALGRSQDDVRMLQHIALRFMRDRLSAIGRAPSRQGAHRSRVRRTRPKLTVLRSRRFALLK